MAGKKGRRGWGWIRPSGRSKKRWHASYLHDGARHNAPHTFGTKLDAEHWLSAERRLIDLDAWTPPAERTAARKAKPITLATYGKTWIEQRTVNGQPLKARTRAQYEALLEGHLKPLGAVPISSLTPAAVRSWHAALGEDSPTMRSHAYGLLHAMLATAVADELIPANPCTIRGATKVRRKRKPVILTVPEVAKLAEVIEPQRFRALILISTWCGLRYGEVTELRRKDIDKDCAVITVARGVTHRGGCFIDTPKSGLGRPVIVPPHIRDDIALHLKTHVARDGEALLFTAPRGGVCDHLNDKTFRTHFMRALKSIGREGVTVHDMRHFCGTQTARVGNLVETMERLGHSTVQASLIYQQAVSGRDAAVAEALSRLAEKQPSDSD
ncbi:MULTISPECIES: site-specific integrase [Mycobacterium]|uniref:Integrase n=1 Tax=Mycobacterium colombiense TaxID=339268 RepID=A0A329MBN1_9MYCO|nr:MULTISPECIES: site-specific integrase [Mycobacterium]MDM4138568.1 site-specific integrase [Mycobacterium sp. FLAC0960]RAV16013.1 integrase [Mycobacterium colombiense]